MKEFWKDGTKGPEVTLYRIKKFFDANGYKAFVLENRTRCIIKLEGKFVSVKQKADLITLLFNTVEGYDFKDDEKRAIVFDKLTTFQAYINRSIENWLSPVTINFIEDTVGTAYMFFTNGIVQISRDSIELKPYEEIEGYVWYESIKPYDIEINQPETYNSLEGMFHTYLFDLVLDDDNLKKLMAVIGYLVHRYKTPTNAKAVIIYDSNVSLTHPSGGTGKSVLCRCIEEATRGLTKNGRNTDLNYRFALEDITIDLDLLVFDDIPENFSLTRLFPDITGNMTLYRKYQTPLQIPFLLSPKILINSNYPLLETGNSFERRKYEFVITSIFSNELKPDEYYGKRLIDDWDDSEWNKFYNTIFKCIQIYLSEGLNPQSQKLSDFLLKNSFDESFLNVAKSMELGRDYNKAELHTQYRKGNTNYVVTQRKFTMLLKDYALLMNYNVNERHSGDENIIAFYR